MFLYFVRLLERIIQDVPCEGIWVYTDSHAIPGRKLPKGRGTCPMAFDRHPRHALGPGAQSAC